MGKKVKLADVLWRAANMNLSDSNEDGSTSFEYSCWAVSEAALQSRCSDYAAIRFLESLGCNTSMVHGFGATPGGERQGVRYMWLLLAMHVAEDEGIEIEVEA
jgi:hypothetical protein